MPRRLLTSSSSTALLLLFLCCRASPPPPLLRRSCSSSAQTPAQLPGTSHDSAASDAGTPARHVLGLKGKTPPHRSPTLPVSLRLGCCRSSANSNTFVGVNCHKLRVLILPDFVVLARCRPKQRRSSSRCPGVLQYHSNARDVSTGNQVNQSPRTSPYLLTCLSRNNINFLLFQQRDQLLKHGDAFCEKPTLSPLTAMGIKLTRADPGERLSRLRSWRTTHLLLVRTCINAGLGCVSLNNSRPTSSFSNLIMTRVATNSSARSR